MVDLPTVDAGVLEELLHALLEVAARKDALRSWPRQQPPDQQPPVQARRDDDGTLGVFRFFTIVAAETRPDPLRELTAEEARARIEGIEGHLHAGDEVGVELPLGRLAAIALADVESTRDAVDGGRSAQLLPPRIVEMLGDRALAAAVTARLSSLRGPPPHVPLRRLIADHGGDVVQWTAVCGEAPPDEPDQLEGPRGQRGELVVLVSRGGEHRLVVVPTATSSAGHGALLRALAPPPAEQGLWRFLELHGPALLCGESSPVSSFAERAPAEAGSLWSEEGPPGENNRRLSLEVTSIAISRDPTVYGVARAKARLLTWSGDKIVDEVDATVGLPVDLPRLVGEPWPEAAALERVRAAAAAFRESLQQRLSALVHARQPTVLDALAGAGFLRVLARAAAGDPASFPFSAPAEPLDLRELADPPASWPEDEIALRLADVGVLVLSPADDVVKLRGHAGSRGDEVIELFAAGGLVDGDADGWRAFCEVCSQAIIDSGVDVELAFPADGEDSDEVETVMLSAWLLALGDPAAAEGLAPRWPLRPRAAESAQALQLLVDRFVDVGPAVGSAPAAAGTPRTRQGR